MATTTEVHAALEALRRAADQFQIEIAKFGAVYKTKVVGLTEWQESIDDTMGELYDEVESE